MCCVCMYGNFLLNRLFVYSSIIFHCVAPKCTMFWYFFSNQLNFNEVLKSKYFVWSFLLLFWKALYCVISTVHRSHCLFYILYEQNVGLIQCKTIIQFCNMIKTIQTDNRILEECPYHYHVCGLNDHAQILCWISWMFSTSPLSIRSLSLSICGPQIWMKKKNAHTQIVFAFSSV